MHDVDFHEQQSLLSLYSRPLVQHDFMSKNMWYSSVNVVYGSWTAYSETILFHKHHTTNNNPELSSQKDVSGCHGSFRRPSKWRIKQYCNYCHLFWNWKRFLNIHDVGFHEHQEYLETTIKSIRVYLTVTRLLVVYSSVQNYSIPLKLVFFAACSFIILLIRVNKYIMSTVY